MRYEVMFGEYTHWCTASTYLQAGLLCLQAWAEDNEDCTNPDGGMIITNMDTGAENIVETSTIVGIQALSNEYQPA